MAEASTPQNLRGRFITFEGGEGSGKSTQARLLGEKLKSLGVGVKLTREPGGSPAAEVIRHILLSGAAKPLGAEAEAMLFAAARDDHLATTIRPALDKGIWVISDRFADSTRVYQGVLGHVDPRLIKRLERIIVGDTWPDLTIVLDVPAEEGLQRAHARRGDAAVDRFEGENADFHGKLREAYRQLVSSEPGRCVLIDATQPREKVAEQIWSLVNDRLDPATAPMVFEDIG
jgi:dTMP kinase